MRNQDQVKQLKSCTRKWLLLTDRIRWCERIRWCAEECYVGHVSGYFTHYNTTYRLDVDIASGEFYPKLTVESIK